MTLFKNFRLLSMAFWVAILGGCAILGLNQAAKLDQLYGQESVRERLVDAGTPGHDFFINDVKPILDNRCVVCHGCYDAPCQLKLSSPAGIDRGGSKERVYDLRVLSMDPSRLFFDENTTEEWRERDFHPVLNERSQSPEANIESSLIYQMLLLKDRQPIPVDGDKPIPAEHFTLGLDRDQSCPTIGEFPQYVKDYPLGGMPYALPKLDRDESLVLKDWLARGGIMANPPKPSKELQKEIDRWEALLNGDSLKSRLVARYLYEHLFLAHIHFDEFGSSSYFRLVRSSTPPGQSISMIQTRLPYDDPGVDRVYYRLWQDPGTVVVKRHLPYAFNQARMDWINKLFFEPAYEVTELPDYEKIVASNPFEAYEAIPVRSRYRFMLEEARYTIMGFIKGPVCRGPVALNSIQDQFWVMFVDPENERVNSLDSFLMENSDNLILPGSTDGYSSLLKSWTGFAGRNLDYLNSKLSLQESWQEDSGPLTLDYIWDGDGNNKNAALTVFRHHDSASVVHGFVGDTPKTAWLINYPLLERIHYLLVAHFDVHGNIGHQVSTRLYMDFLRQEGEISFLTLLPQEQRSKVLGEWYQDADKEVSEHVQQCSALLDTKVNGLNLVSDNPKQELLSLLGDYLEPVLERKYSLDHPEIPSNHRGFLKRVAQLGGYDIQLLPETTVLLINEPDGTRHLYSILRNNEHTNINSLFDEDKTIVPEDANLTVVRGIIGDYPSAFWRVESADIPEFEKMLNELTDEASYQDFMTRFGVRRSHTDFWGHSDRVHLAFKEMEPIDAGLLDYNRIENR